MDLLELQARMCGVLGELAIGFFRLILDVRRKLLEGLTKAFGRFRDQRSLRSIVWDLPARCSLSASLAKMSREGISVSPNARPHAFSDSRSCSRALARA